MEVNSLFRLTLLVGLVFASLGGSHAANAETMIVVESEQALLISGGHDDIQVKSDKSHCPDEIDESVQTNPGSGCCIAACNAFQLSEPVISTFHRLPIQILVPSMVQSAEGLKPESVYRPPQA